jgi:uncharacterized protein YndB with AHSA1/START domain
MSASDDRNVFEFSRKFRRHRAAVWKAWSESDQLKQWWGPKGCTIQVGRFEFRPGGFFHYSMKFDDGSAMWGRFCYREIAAPDRLVWLSSFANERCGIARAPFSDRCPLEIQNTVTFREHDGITTLQLRAEPFGANEAECAFFAELCSSGSLKDGYGGTFEQLASHLAKG